MIPDPNDPVARALAHCRALPISAIAGLFERYGRPLEAPGPLDPLVELEDGSRVGRLAYRSPVDVIANDWFVRERGTTERLAIAGPLFAAIVERLYTSST